MLGKNAKKGVPNETYNGGQFEAWDGLINRDLKLGGLVSVSSESNSNTVLGKGVFGVDHSQKSITTSCEADLLSLVIKLIT